MEQTRLSFAPQPARVGQTGEFIPFPAFNLEMTGSDFTIAVRRANPSDVSESQREFIDLAFRMALIKTAGSGGQGSLVIDAPESSLDTVFATRAAQILARFATSAEENRLLVTSNVVEGSLVPNLLREAVGPVERKSRIVDLFDVARPTAAYTENKAAYDKARRDFVYAD